MSSRERWVVYPLVFLTLGIALKDKITRDVSVKRLQCESLLVTDRQGERQVYISANQSGNTLHARSTNRGPDVILGQVEVSNGRQLAGMMFADEQGRFLTRPGVVVPMIPREPKQAEPQKESGKPQIVAEPVQQTPAEKPVADQPDDAK
jgi:hypothetical protein